MRLLHRALVACAIAPALAGAPARGQQPQSEPPAQPQEGAAIPAASDKSPFSLQFNLDYTTAYFFHGIVQEDTGLILQPATKLTISLYEKDDLAIEANLGTWSSFHGQKTGAQTRDDFMDYWYELDLIGGITLTKGNWSLATTYTLYTSPNDAYDSFPELDFTLAYEDADLLGKFALHPYILVGFETGADGSDGADSDPGTYCELGIAPGFDFDIGKTPVSVSFPGSIGLSLHEYYQDDEGKDDTFGYAQVGVKASVPLPFGDRYGKWTLSAGLAALFLGDHTAEFNGGDHEQVIATVGLQLNF